MAESVLERLFEHNLWANERILDACFALGDDQLDAEPASATKGSIRLTLIHLVSSQRGYLGLLTLPVEERSRGPVAFADLRESAAASGEGLLALARDRESDRWTTRLQTTDGYLVDPWVVMLQAINHATEHREQLKSMLSALGVEPPDIDGWDYGEARGALVEENDHGAARDA
jgi:uncharacterized damage-inducible protein DinB